jgi:hypothetical protein
LALRNVVLCIGDVTVGQLETAHDSIFDADEINTQVVNVPAMYFQTKCLLHGEGDVEDCTFHIIDIEKVQEALGASFGTMGICDTCFIVNAYLGSHYAPMNTVLAVVFASDLKVWQHPSLKTTLDRIFCGTDSEMVPIFVE